MDQPLLDPAAHRRALDGLKTANAISRVSQVLWRAIAEANCRAAKDRPLRILDIASGGGDVIIGISKMAARRGVDVRAHGWDISPTAVDHARAAAAKAGVLCSFDVHNALIDELPCNYDVVVSTLFLHHLSDNEARGLLCRMAAATRHCVIIDDLCRNNLGYLYAWTGVRVLTRSRIVHVDGPLSVRAAYTIREVTQIAREAGMQNVQFKRHWPQRFVMIWTR